PLSRPHHRVPPFAPGSLGVAGAFPGGVARLRGPPVLRSPERQLLESGPRSAGNHRLEHPAQLPRRLPPLSALLAAHAERGPGTHLAAGAGADVPGRCAVPSPGALAPLGVARLADRRRLLANPSVHPAASAVAENHSPRRYPQLLACRAHP